MRVSTVHIENYRNISFAYAENLPNLMVIGGTNGSGKSAVLEAIYTVKEAVSLYDKDFKTEKNVVSAFSKFASIRLVMEFSETDKKFAKDILEVDCPDTAELFAQINPDGSIEGTSAPYGVRIMLSNYIQGNNVPGFFDYYPSVRRIPSNKWHRDSFHFSADDIKPNLTGTEDKYRCVKNYLASLRVNHLQLFEEAVAAGKILEKSPLLEIENFFNHFFPPLVFKRIDVNSSPIRFRIETPSGEIDIDELSSGEKEIFYAAVRFHELNPKGAVILFDEPDLHLHPDFARRFMSVLETLSERNQVIITTPSPEMMIGVNTESLYTIQKEPNKKEFSQLFPVIHDIDLYASLSNALGARGIMSSSQQVVFVEGEYSSTDIAYFEAAYPQTRYGVQFVPVQQVQGGFKSIAQLNEIISKPIGYQHFYCIVGPDRLAESEDVSALKHIVRLPVHHAENFLIDEDKILNITKLLNQEKCPFFTQEEVAQELTTLLLGTHHLTSFAKTIADEKIRQVVREVQSAIDNNNGTIALHYENISSESLVEEAKKILTESIEKNTWKHRCKGRELLRAYCSAQGIQYEIFRKLLIREIRAPHPLLKAIMDPILAENASVTSEMPAFIPRKNDVPPIDRSIKETAIHNLDPNVEPPEEDAKIIPDGAVKIEDYLFEFVEGNCKISGPDKVTLRRIAKESNRIIATNYAKKYLEFFENAIYGQVDSVRKREIIDILGIPLKTKK
jgi:predicted ATPase